MQSIRLDAVPVKSRDIRKSFEGLPESDFLYKLTPYDVPEFVVSEYDRERGKLVIRFAYITSEPSEKTEAETNDVWLTFGRESGRIYGIEAIKPELNNEFDFRRAMIRALDGRIHALDTEENTIKELNTRLIKGLIEKFASLFKQK